jgi:hypothetical protein
MVAVQVEIWQKNSQYTKINKVLGTDNEFKPGMLILGHLLPL